MTHREQDDFERLATRLGQAGDGVDLDRVAAGVVSGLRESTPAMGQWWPSRAWRVAAAVAVLVVGTVMAERVVRGPNAPVPMAVAPVGLDELDAGELTEVLDSLEYEGPAVQFVRVGLEDLDAAQLDELLAAMEGE